MVSRTHRNFRLAHDPTANPVMRAFGHSKRAVILTLSAAKRKNLRLPLSLRPKQGHRTGERIEGLEASAQDYPY